MLSFHRLNSDSSCIELDFWSGRHHPRQRWISVSDSIWLDYHFRYCLDSWEVGCRSVSNHHPSWGQKVDLQSTDNAVPNHVTVNETVIQPSLSDIGCRLRLIPTRTACSTSGCICRNQGNILDVSLRILWKISGRRRNLSCRWCPAVTVACHRHGLWFQHVTHGDRNGIERVFRTVKRRTDQFSNTFSYAEPSTAEN